MSRPSGPHPVSLREPDLSRKRERQKDGADACADEMCESGSPEERGIRARSYTSPWGEVEIAERFRVRG